MAPMSPMMPSPVADLQPRQRSQTAGHRASPPLPSPRVGDGQAVGLAQSGQLVEQPLGHGLDPVAAPTTTALVVEPRRPRRHPPTDDQDAATVRAAAGPVGVVAQGLSVGRSEYSLVTSYRLLGRRQTVRQARDGAALGAADTAQTQARYLDAGTSETSTNDGLDHLDRYREARVGRPHVGQVAPSPAMARLRSRRVSRPSGSRSSDTLIGQPVAQASEPAIRTAARIAQAQRPRMRGERGPTAAHDS